MAGPFVAGMGSLSDTPQFSVAAPVASTRNEAGQQFRIFGLGVIGEGFSGWAFSLLESRKQEEGG
jgi:hypothetical protein